MYKPVSKYRKRVRGLAAMVLTAAAGLLSMTLPAHAGPQDHLTDPRLRCNTNAGLIATRGIEDELGRVVSYVDVYYSYLCQTNWIRVRSNPAGGNAFKELWADGQPGKSVENDPGYDASFTMQVYAPGTTCIHFRVHLYWPDGRSYGETYSAGSNYITIC